MQSTYRQQEHIDTRTWGRLLACMQACTQAHTESQHAHKHSNSVRHAHAFVRQSQSSDVCMDAHKRVSTHFTVRTQARMKERVCNGIACLCWISVTRLAWYILSIAEKTQMDLRVGVMGDLLSIMYSATSKGLIRTAEPIRCSIFFVSRVRRWVRKIDPWRPCHINIVMTVIVIISITILSTPFVVDGVVRNNDFIMRIVVVFSACLWSSLCSL